MFTVSIRQDIDKTFVFPEPIELKLHLKDMLEDSVDDKYFVSDKMKVYISKTGGGGYRNKDSRINLQEARPITTIPNKRAGTTNYVCKEAKDNFDLCGNE